MTYHNPTHKPACSSRISHHMESGGRHAHSILLKSAAAVLLLLLTAAFFCGAAAAVVTEVYDEAALREAVTQPDFDVKLCADIKLTDFYKTGRDNSLVIPPAVTKGTIDLNGHTLLYAGCDSTQSGDNNGAVIIIKSGELTVNDSSSEKTGKITGGRGTHTLMTYGQNYLFGGGVYVADGARLILNGGSISENRIDNGGMIDAAGAGVYADGYGEVTMNGGSISNNYASAKNGYGAGVHIRRGSFTMTGGTISGNIASSSNSVGGGVYLWGNVKFKMTGGIISGNSANRGGGVYVNSGATFSVKGDVSIMDNSKNDVALIDGHFRTIPKGMLNLIGPLSGTVLVVLDDQYGYRGPSFGKVTGGADIAKHIINEKDGKYAVKNENDELIWGVDTFSGTLITLDWNDKDKFYGDKTGHVAAVKDQTTSFPITPISKPGYTFTGWYLQGQGGTAPLIYVNGTLAKGVESYTDADGKWIYTEKTLTLVAGWNHDGPTLTLDGNGGTPISQQVKVTYDSSSVSYTPLNRTDSQTAITYTFCGWYLDRGHTTLLINTNGTLVKGVMIGDTEYTDANGKWVYGKTTYDKTTLTLYAGWSADGTQLTFDGLPGEPAKQIVSVARNETKVSGITLSVIDGYACTGWYIGETVQATGSPIKLINRDGTLVISNATKEYVTESEGWKYNKTTLPLKADWVTDVTYHNGTESTLISYPVGHEVDIPQAPASDGSFFGWRVGSPTGPFIFFYQKGSGYQYLTPSPYYNYEGGKCYWASKAEKLDLYAAILEGEGEGQGSVRFSVTYDKNKADSGRVPKETEWYAPGDKVTVCGNTGALEKYGYTFSGWNTQADGMGTNYAAGSTISDIREDITLYAKWMVKTPEKKTWKPEGQTDYVLIFEEIPSKNSIIILSAENVSPDGITIGPAVVKDPEKADGSAKNKVYALFDMKAEANLPGDGVNIVIGARLSSGEKPGNVCLRHYTGTPGSGSWDSEAIRPTEAAEDSSMQGLWMFVFNIKEFSPFALTYEVPAEKRSSSRDQGSSVWLTATPTPTPTVEATPEPTLQQPTASPVKTPTQPPASPAPVAGIIAGLGAAGIIAVMRRK